MARTPAILLILMLLATPAQARDPLGVFGEWGAFRDSKPNRCFAIAEPQERARKDGRRAFASVAIWPSRALNSQFHTRLRKNRKRQTPVELAIGAVRFRLVAGIADAWAPDARTDAAIVRAMRSGEWMRITARDTNNKPFGDSYALRGAATAIDAVILGCARRR